ncbi:MAG: homoserine O-acetyltransferase [Muribaculaceae bacterium]|nr:homoserine O-acetyltransferase [Muribaculaceae bacterium]
MDKRGTFLTYTYTEEFPLEQGGTLPGITIAYHTYGRLNEKRDNCIWVCHALTANSDVADWWPHTVVPDGFLDPEKYFIVCANIIGSCYGSTGPLSINPETGEPWYDAFPKLTIRDMVKAHSLLADHLGIFSIFSLLGSSVGGFQAFEWAITEPHRFKSMVLIATAPYASPWAIAIDETQRMTIFADHTYGEKRADAARQGLSAARAIALLTYRGARGYNLTQQDIHSPEDGVPTYHRACSYQKYQGEKLVKRFDAYSYVAILDAFDTHNVGRGRNGIQAALRRVDFPVVCVGITSDIIFTPEEMISFTSFFPNAKYREISSQFGHDGFLVEHSLLNTIIKDFYNSLPFTPELPKELSDEEPEDEKKRRKSKTKRARRKDDPEDPHPQLPVTPNIPIPE